MVSIPSMPLLTVPETSVMEEESRGGVIGRTAARIGVAGAIALGAVASGMLLSRSGRRLLGEVWQGRQRTTIEDRVLDALWRDPLVGRRRIDVIELPEGVVAVTGAVRTEAERDRALALVRHARGVSGIEDRLEIVPGGRPAGQTAGRPQPDHN